MWSRDTSACRANNLPQSLGRLPEKTERPLKSLFRIKRCRAERNECDAARFCIFVTITPNSKLILCRRRAMVSRWLPYLRGTVWTTAHASLDKGPSLWSSYDTLSPSHEPLPRSPSFSFLLLYSFLPSISLSPLLSLFFILMRYDIIYPHAYIFNTCSWVIMHFGETPTPASASLQSDFVLIRIVPPLSEFKVKEKALESRSDLMLLTDQTDSRRKWKLCKPREHL